MSAPYPFPPVRPTAAELVRETKVLRRWLINYGVDRSDVDDMAAEVIIAAWRAGQEDRFRPDPAVPDRIALLGWLKGIMWRTASNFLNSAQHRREIPRGGADMTDGSSVNLEAQVIARDEMALLAGVRFERRMILLAHAAGCGMPEIAEAAGINTSTAWSRLRQGRLDLLAILRRRAARDRR
jgi:DNA-directed RNA polymerase specialized sigma24 family protein